MMKRIFAWALILVLACIPAAANAADDYDTVIGGILAHLSGGDVQEWIDTTLSQSAGGSMDSAVIPLLHMQGGYDFSVYADALAQKLQQGVKSVTTRQRCALLLKVLNPDAQISEGFADETIGEMGVMSYVFGLHLLNNGFASEKWTAGSIVDALASLQLADGGWAVSSQYSDPDVSAMVLQALAAVDNPSYGCTKMIESALTYLSDAQNSDGGYTSYGKPACESSAQVIIALNSLGIDPLSEAGFIKDGRTALDAMLSFRLEDGSFSHTNDAKPNTMACIQALSALVALKNPKLVFFDFSGVSLASAATNPAALPLWKLIAFGCIGLFFLLGSIVSILKKRARGKRLLLVLIISALAAYGVFAINIESTSGYYSEVQKNEVPAGQVWLSIDCSTVAGREDEKITPANGKILSRSQFDFYEGDSVFDVLTYAARKYGIQMESTGTGGDLTYVNGINHLYEYAYGELSGWIYTVNGEKLSVGCANYTVSDGEEIAWHYTLNLGEDIK